MDVIFLKIRLYRRFAIIYAGAPINELTVLGLICGQNQRCNTIAQLITPRLHPDPFLPDKITTPLRTKLYVYILCIITLFNIK
jgi:hypothetical protein